MKQILGYWEQLQSRERHALIAGGVGLLLLSFYGLVWEPYSSSKDELGKTVTERQAVLSYMEQAAREVQQLRASRPNVARAMGGSLLALADSTAKAQGLGPSVKRVQPDGEHAVQVWLEEVSFDQMLLWLDSLEREHGVRVSGLVADRRDEPGRVNARLTLEGVTG